MALSSDKELGSGVMADLLRDVPLRPCSGCEHLHVGVLCLYYQATITEPDTLYRCVRFLEQQPVTPW